VDAARDGYTWASGAAKDLGTYAVSGVLDTRITDWNLYLAVANQSVVGVNPDAPWKTFDQLIQAMKDKPARSRWRPPASTPRASSASRRSPRRRASPTSTSATTAATRR
jgi:tripartite-type tricarboxylate transporter receptor subunit TctC